ncbi:MAG: DUF1287 domain-containing protein [Deltaproteobacteria bacterium]|jgi:uncharacterized protein|nr:DUF1287 domain-containing protein [Deltaproteobacteria bacterium]MBT4525461.1 DUF1287 domain-containing protein [Deltaproteobacteria bacterium]
MNIIKILFLICIFPVSIWAGEFQQDLVKAALFRTTQDVRYDGSYYSIAYPGGDVPAGIGVCTDVIIRSYRAIGFDLQKAVHEDMSENFKLYPSKRIWGLKKPDKNIDHRRVPNLQIYFKRFGETLRKSNQPYDYHPGDLITWMIPGNLPHIGIVSDQKNISRNRPLMVHNIGIGPKLEDMLFDFKITGHYRFVPPDYKKD